MIEEAIKYGVYTPTNDNTVKDLIVLENILWRNFKISEHYEEMHPVPNQFIFYQYSSLNP